VAGGSSRSGERWPFSENFAEFLCTHGQRAERRCLGSEAQGEPEFSYVLIDPRVGPDARPLTGRFAAGPSLDGHGEFSVRAAEPLGQAPMLAPPIPRGGAQTEQMDGAADT